MRASKLVAACLAVGARSWEGVPPSPAYIPWHPDEKEDEALIAKKTKEEMAGNVVHTHHKHKHKGKDGKVVMVQDEDVEEFHFHFHIKTPSFGNFKMDESSTMLHELLQNLGANHTARVDYANTIAKQHHLAEPNSTKLIARLASTIADLKKDKAPFVLAALHADFPNMDKAEQKSRLIDTLEVALANAPKVSAAKSSAKPAAHKRDGAKLQKATATKAVAKPAAKLMLKAKK